MALIPDALAAQGARVKRPRIPTPRPSLRSTRTSLALETLETRMLLATVSAGDPASVTSWGYAVVADQGVTIHMETTAEDHTLILQGNGDASTMVTLNTDQLAPEIDRIAVDGVNWVRLTGSRSFETVELSNVHYADLGATGISLVLYASKVDRLQVNATDLTAVITGGSTLLQSERFNGALLLTDAADLRLSSSHVASNLSIVSLNSQNTVALDFSVGSLSLVNFTTPVRLLPFDSSLLNAPPAPILQPVVIPVAIAPTLPAVTAPPSLTLEPVLPDTPVEALPVSLAPPVAVAPPSDLPLQSITFPTVLDIAATPAGNASLPTLKPVAATPTTVPGADSVEGGVEITAKVGEVLDALPTDLGAQLPEKLAALPSPVTPVLSSELKHLITQALIAAQTTPAAPGTPLLLEETTAPSAAPAATTVGGESRADHHPTVEEAVAKHPRVEKNISPALAAHVWEHQSSANHPSEFSSNEGQNLGGEIKVGGSTAAITSATLEAFAPGNSKRSTTLRHPAFSSGGDDQTEGDGQMLLFSLPSAFRRELRDDRDAGQSTVAPTEKTTGWISALAGVSKLASDWSERLWPYSRPVQVSELKTYLVEQFLAEVTPGERSLLLVDPARLRPAPAFAVV